ncbi:MAG TPA: RNA polymerase sigma factor [Thermoanaerobaculia bacterium]|nr:RNA polymerase sigma factor [Thermoanaerobaculia bacterium]
MPDLSSRGSPALEEPFAGEPDFARLRNDLVKAVAKICPGWLADRRDDLVQAALMKVWDISRRREGILELSSSYLYRVAHSALVDEIRARRRRHEVNLDDSENERATPTTAPDPNATAAAAEIGRGIRECLGGLVRDRRLAVALYLQGHGVPDSSRLLDWPAKRTENLVYRGLADLRRCLAGKGLEP